LIAVFAFLAGYACRRFLNQTAFDGHLMNQTILSNFDQFYKTPSLPVRYIKILWLAKIPKRN
jgi:hypothetical protein